MANTLRFKRGLASGLPTGLAGEPLFTTDTFDLYIGNGTGNTRFQKYIASGTTGQLLRGDGSLLTMPIVLTSPSSGQVLKYNGTSWVNDSDSGITGSGASGRVAFWTGTSTQSSNANLFWDNTNSRLGVGTTSPSGSFDVFSTSNTYANISTNLSFGSTVLSFYNSVGNGDGAAIGYNVAMRFGTITGLNASGWTERARITATGNFIINNPSVDNGLRFQVTGDGYFSGNLLIGTSSSGFNTAGLPLIVGSGTGNTGMTIFSGNASYGSIHFADAVTTGGASYAGFINYNHSLNSMQFGTSSSDKMILDASGNLGLGVTPSAWGAGYKAFQIGSDSSLFATTGGGDVSIQTNIYFDGTNWRYIRSGLHATHYYQTSGQHVWRTAPTGTAGNIPTFTQAMTLTANGRLLLGTTTEGTQLLQVAGTMR